MDKIREMYILRVIISNLPFHSENMMRLLLVGLLVVVVRGNNYEQQSYEMIYERAVLSYFNPNVFKYLKLDNTKLNRTTKSISVYYENIADLINFTVTLQAYVFINNEYRNFAIRFAVDGCKALDKNYFGISEILKLGNITTCPIKPGIHYVKDYVPDATKFPPNIPERSYKLIASISTVSKDLVIAEFFFTVKKIFRWRKIGHQ